MEPGGLGYREEGLERRGGVGARGKILLAGAAPKLSFVVGMLVVGKVYINV